MDYSCFTFVTSTKPFRDLDDLAVKQENTSSFLI